MGKRVITIEYGGRTRVGHALKRVNDLNSQPGGTDESMKEFREAIEDLGHLVYEPAFKTGAAHPWPSKDKPGPRVRWWTTRKP